MNILLSAYACEPNKGSEPGVGWSWAIELAKHHSVWVLTRDNNESTINEYLQKYPTYQNTNLHFIYVGLSPKLTFWKKGRRGMRLFYMMWQYKATKIAQKLHKNINFDLVQHVTFVSYTQPSYMYKLGIPMIWGPVSGGENIPFSLNVKLTFKEKFIEFVRRVSQKIALVTPSIRKTMNNSKYILVATEESKNEIPPKFWNKTKIIPAIGLEKIPLFYKEKKENDKLKIIMAGRLIYWKAFDIGINAFLKIAEKYPYVELHILGEGEKKESLKHLAGKYLNKQIFFEEPIQHDDIYKFYSGFDIFMNTTLRDSGCMTMLEAMSVGLPCVAVATGGPKVLLQENPELSILPKDYISTCEALAKVLEQLIEDVELRQRLGESMKYSAKKFLLENKYKFIFENQDYEVK